MNSTFKAQVNSHFFQPWSQPALFSSDLLYRSLSPALCLLLVLLPTTADSGVLMKTFMNIPFFLQWGCTWDNDVIGPAVFFPRTLGARHIQLAQFIMKMNW